MIYTLIGKKVGMTQVYDGENRLLPVTVVEAGPCYVAQVKTSDTDGYNAIQIGYGSKRAKRITKSEAGHFKKAGVEAKATLREVRCPESTEYKVGDVLTVSGFEEGQKVDIVGVTKGKGFQGVMKRYNFGGGPDSHGSMTHRRGGSYGQCQWPGRVYKGRKMPGHMGHVRRTVQNLQVVRIIEDKNVILLKGSLPGANGSQILIRTAKKTKTAA